MAGLWLSHHIGNFSIPTDELLIFFGGVGMPPTRYSSWGFWFFRDLLEAYLAPAFSILHPTQPFYRATVTKTPPALCGFRDGPVYIYYSNPQKDQKDRTVMYHDVSLFVFSILHPDTSLISLPKIENGFYSSIFWQLQGSFPNVTSNPRPIAGALRSRWLYATRWLDSTRSKIRMG